MQRLSTSSDSFSTRMLSFRFAESVAITRPSFAHPSRLENGPPVGGTPVTYLKFSRQEVVLLETDPRCHLLRHRTQSSVIQHDVISTNPCHAFPRSVAPGASPGAPPAQAVGAGRGTANSTQTQRGMHPPYFCPRIHSPTFASSKSSGSGP